MEPGEGPEEDQSISGSERYFCPFPGCKRSFAELWRLKVHYRAPPDIRGSGKERGHGTELTHCPKCGKGLKPGKHHVGCSGGKAAPRQAKRQRQAAAANTMAVQEGMNGDAQAMYGNCMVMPGAYGQGMPAGMPPNGYGAAYGQQYAPFPHQQYQPDMSGSYFQGQPHPMGGLLQQQPQMQPQQQGIQSPTLGMGLAQDQLNSTGSVVLQGGPGDMLMGNSQGYQYQQQAMPLQQQQQQQQLMPMQQQQEQQELLQPHPELIQPQQPMLDMLDSSHLQQPQQQQLMMQQPQVKQEPVTMGMAHQVNTASGAYMAQQQQQQAMQHQQMLLPQDQGYLGQDAAAAGLMPPPPPVQMVHMQQQQPMLQQPAEAVQQQPQHVQQQQQQQMLPPAPVPPPPAPSQLQPAPGLTTQISSSLFDDIDNMSAAAAGTGSSSSGAGAAPESTRAPSPPPLPADFPQASGMGTLFNFSQFSQKLPAAQGPSQQMAMMPRGMEQELPPSMDELWTPEATYDHHSDGDLMQLLFGAPEQPPTMATIHLHHFLEDDACSSPLLTGLIGGSMDDLRAAEAKAGGDRAAGGAGATAHAIAAGPPHAQPAAAPPADGKAAVHASTAGMMLPPAAVPLEPHQHAMHQYQHHPQQQQQQQGLLVPKLEQQQLQPGVNGVIHSQCGASATIQVHMQMHGGDAAASAAAGMVQIKGEDGCMMQKAVPSMPGAVASRAT
ncbi:hypothetical protein OEZ85_007670 [Tetradesmus obliquus]|uniref:C2H2-type domain-containing protein n=1 Tax=Tetradesmus obliquus TaxID=3088 RepID=A0ABY8TIE4_TETOB|nr:hypothetical protein OEZ85_007670 [Tetradesmus obliquus]